LQYLENNKFDAAACDYLIVDDQEKVIKREDCLKKPIACGILFKKEHLIKIGMYDPEFFLNEEVDLQFRFKKKYSLGRLDVPLYRYRIHKNNMTKNKKKKYFFDKKFKVKHNLN
jgi:hypothetical protein